MHQESVGESMFLFMNKRENLDEKGIAKLLYKDVSTNSWDRANLTKYNLDFSTDSLLYIDEYVENLLKDSNKELLTKYTSNLAYRIGAYMGEVMKVHIPKDFKWYELKTIKKYSSKLDQYDWDKTTVHLYSKKTDTVIFPSFEASEFLNGRSSYPKLSVYVKDMLRLHK